MHTYPSMCRGGYTTYTWLGDVVWPYTGSLRKLGCALPAVHRTLARDGETVAQLLHSPPPHWEKVVLTVVDVDVCVGGV